MIDSKHGWNLSFKPLYLGLTLSLILILAAYRTVTHYHLQHTTLMFTIFGMAILQGIFQLIFFFHLGLGEQKPHWNVITFLFTVLILVIIIGGTLWIMYNLGYNLMPDMEPNPY